MHSMSTAMDEEPLNLCLKDEQRFTDSGNEDRFSSPGLGMGSNSSCGGDVDDDHDGVNDDDDVGMGGSSAGRSSGPETALSVLEQINSLRKFIHEKRLSEFYEMYLRQLRVLFSYSVHSPHCVKTPL